MYFEINHNFGHDICNMLSDEGFVNIELKKDINDKERMIKAILKELFLNVIIKSHNIWLQIKIS